jgi:hypothetical protein
MQEEIDSIVRGHVDSDASERQVSMPWLCVFTYMIGLESPHVRWAV